MIYAYMKRATSGAMAIMLLLMMMYSSSTLARDVESCTRCHDEASEYPVLNILQTPHASKADSRTGFAAHGCESCHGDGTEHLKPPVEGEKRLPPVTTFRHGAASSVAEQNKACMSCHDDGQRMHWRGSSHDAEDLSCASCHTVHAPRDPILSASDQTGVCVTCHTRQHSESVRPSTHPLHEGLMSCSDCHNPHGSLNPTLLVSSNVNETCYNCHAEKRGPVLWEHAPVSEDCTTCHQPHGSIHEPMLITRGPQLCQQCHLGTHSSAAIGGDAITDGSVFAAGNNCLNCHSQVHGSNHPLGQSLTR